MYAIDISDKDANQSFTVSLNGRTLYVRFCTFRGMLFFDAEIDGVPVVTGRRVVGGMRLLPKRYEESLGGNVAVWTSEGVGDYPSYSDMDGLNGIFLYTGEGVDV